MYADILRSYSAAAIGPASNPSINGDWLHRTSSREPLRLKLSILSDINPRTRSILNGNSPIRSHPSTWSMHSEVDRHLTSRQHDFDKPNYGRDDGVTLAVVGIKRTASNWIPPSDYEDHFLARPSSPTTDTRPTPSKFPGYYSKAEKVSVHNGSMAAPFTGSSFLNGTERLEPESLNGKGNFSHDQQRGIGAGSTSNPYRCHIDVDDALDEVFASIVRGALSDDAVSPRQRQTLPVSIENVERACYIVDEESTSTKNKRIQSRHHDHLTQPFFVKRTTSSSAVFDSVPSHSRHHQQQQQPSARPGKLDGQANVENREKPFSQLEKVSTGVELKKSTPAQLNDESDSLVASSYHPYYYRSAPAPDTALISKASSHKSVPHPTEPFAPKREKEDHFPRSNRNLQKSEPYLNRRHESLEKIESFIDNGRNRDGVENRTKKVHSEGKDERLASGVTSYYCGEDITTASSNRRHLFNQSGRGKLRAAKSESSLRMANKELVLSDKEIYQIEIMNSGLSASRVYVCQCLANLYFDDGACASNGKRSDSPWRRIATGVPVLVLETEQAGAGQKPSKDQRQLRKLLIRLAELGNGFKLWEDVIDAFSGYSVDRTFHTLATSADYNRRAGLSFDNHSAALKFHQHVREFSEELDSFGLDGGANGRRRPSKSIWSAFRRMNTGTTDGVSASNGGSYSGNIRQPDIAFGSNRRNSNWQPGIGLTQDLTGPVKKTDISMPCCFKHVTSLKAGDVLPSAMLVNSSACPSSVSSSTNTLTRVNRSATIKSTNAKSQSPAFADDGLGSVDSGINLPKRAQSCTQILNDHSQKRASIDEDRLMPYQSTGDSTSSYYSSEATNGSLRRRYPHSFEPVV